MADKKAPTQKFSIRNVGSAPVPLWVEGPDGQPVEESLPIGSKVTRAIHPAHFDYLIARPDVQVVRAERDEDEADLGELGTQLPADNLDTLDLDQLNSVAADEGADIAGKKKNSDIVQAIRDNRAAKAAQAAAAEA